MLADQLDYVVGVDPHRDAHSIGIVDVRTGVVVFEAAVRADSAGYEEALRLAEQHAPGRRAFAVEGTASFGAGLTRFLVERGEQVFEVGRAPPRTSLRRQDRRHRCGPRGEKRSRPEATRAPAQQRRTRGAARADGGA